MVMTGVTKTKDCRRFRESVDDARRMLALSTSGFNDGEALPMISLAFKLSGAKGLNDGLLE
jgi:hypothetical protein